MLTLTPLNNLGAVLQERSSTLVCFLKCSCGRISIEGISRITMLNQLLVLKGGIRFDLNSFTILPFICSAIHSNPLGYGN